jgi:cellulose synthase/poly-beta-1,6-N-acetylglucosamine synthase-like glycosyltransferase
LRYSISAHIPFFNNIDTLEQVIQSISSEGINLRDVSIYDDGSSTDPSSICKSTNTTLHQYKRNKGRGFIRNKATSDAESDLILFCDATNLLSDKFIENALHYFEQKQVAAVSGKISNHPSIKNFSSAWRGRHLFKDRYDFGPIAQEASSLTTYGTILRRSAVLDVGNFNPELVHSEDKELGNRLLKAGYRIIGDPNLTVYSIKKDTIFSVLERYWRWYGGTGEKFTLKDYWHAIKASFRPMMQDDIRANDWRSAFISFLCPHYGFFRNLYRKLSGKTQKLS